MVTLVSEIHWQRSTGCVEINATRAAMIRKTAALVSTGVAAEEAFGIDGLWLENKGMVLIEWVFDLLRQLVTFGVEGKVAICACVDGAEGVELAGRTVQNLAKCLKI